MDQPSVPDQAQLDAAMAELRDHLANPVRMQATLAATPAGAIPPFLLTILQLAGPLLQQLAPIVIQQLGPILQQLLTTWLGSLTVPPVVPPVAPPKSPAIPNLPS